MGMHWGLTGGAFRGFWGRGGNTEDTQKYLLQTLPTAHTICMHTIFVNKERDREGEERGRRVRSLFIHSYKKRKETLHKK